MKKIKVGLFTTTFISIATHLIFVFSISKLSAPLLIKQDKSLIEFSVHSQKNTHTKKIKNPNRKSLKLKKTGTKNSLNISNLKPSNHSSHLATANNFTVEQSKEISGGYNDSSYDKFSEAEGAFGVMNSMGAAEYTENIWFYELLWNKLNYGSDYPEDLAKQRVNGNVNVHILVSNKGELLDILEVTGPESLLKAYVVTNLIHTLKKPIGKKNWLQGRIKIPLLITYEFILHELAGNKHHNPDFTDQGNHLKNTFVIKKHRVIDNRITQYYAENIAPFVPPIVPIPGGFIIDFVAAYNMIKNWGEPTEPVKRKHRLKLLKQSLNSTIKKQTANKK